MENCKKCDRESEYFCPDCGRLYCKKCKLDICERSDCQGIPLSIAVLKG